MALGFFVSKEMFELFYLTKMKENSFDSKNGYFLHWKERMGKIKEGIKWFFCAMVIRLMIQNTNDLGGKSMI